MIVHHPHSLHEGVADGTAYEGKTLFFQAFTHGVALGGGHRYVRHFFDAVNYRFATNEAPQQVGEGTELDYDIWGIGAIEQHYRLTK